MRCPSKLKVEDVKTKPSCEISLKIWKLKMWKRSVRARHPFAVTSFCFDMPLCTAVPRLFHQTFMEGLDIVKGDWNKSFDFYQSCPRPRTSKDLKRWFLVERMFVFNIVCFQVVDMGWINQFDFFSWLPKVVRNIVMLRIDINMSTKSSKSHTLRNARAWNFWFLEDFFQGQGLIPGWKFQVVFL